MGVPAAPRYPDELLLAIEALDDPSQPLAETCRRVAEWAVSHGYVRPSTAGLRRYVSRERERQAQLKRVREDVATRFVLGLRVDAYEVEAAVARANRGVSRS